MTDPKSDRRPPKKRLGAIGRKPVSTGRDELVRFGSLELGEPLPRLAEPARAGIDLAGWAREHRRRVDAELGAHGGLLFRGFELSSVEEFEHFMHALTDQLMDYTYRSTPRESVEGKVFTSTEYPREQTIPLHNEMAYSRRWPMKIWFFCRQSAERGGETPIADSRAVYGEIDPAVRARFEELGVLYVRNYGGGLDLSWENVFQTDDRAEVESYCRRAGIEWEWLGDDRLRTRERCQAVATHPRTGEKVWFNQAHLFHVSSLAPEARSLLTASLAPEDLPRNAYYGNGTEIEAAALEEIRRAFDRHARVFPWRPGDVLYLDNMLVAHGRRPFEGPRQVLVGMAEPYAGPAAGAGGGEV